MPNAHTSVFSECKVGTLELAWTSSGAQNNIVPFSVLASNSVSDSEVAARTTARTSTIEDRIGSLGKSLTQNPAYLRKVPPQTFNGMPVDGISLREDGPNVQLGNFYLSSCPGKKG